MNGVGLPGGKRPALAVNLAILLSGLALIGLAIAADRDWSDRHFLPTFAWPREFQMRIILGLRLLAGLLGLFVIFVVRPRFVRTVAAGRGRQLALTTFLALLAVVAAVGVTEAVLRTRTWQATQERWGSQEPLRQRDRELGWTFVPDHAGQAPFRARTVAYATDRLGYRVNAVGDRFDPGAPTIVFAGESILFGYGLQWPDSVPARVGAMSGLQTVNISVNAYANDQIYLRLKRELPRFARPVAVVVPFVPMLFDRNLDRDRPYLDGSLRWHAGRPPPWRLVELMRRMVRYRSEAEIERGVATTRRILQATVGLVRSRQAQPIIVVPQYMPEEPTERAVRKRVLDEAGLPYVLVRLDPRWRIETDRHPDARGAQAIAAAILQRLELEARTGATRAPGDATPPAAAGAGAGSG